MTQFLKAWKARLIAVGAAVAGVLQLLQPQWLIDIFGPQSSGWVNVILVVGAFLLNQLLTNTTANAVEKDA
jgi:hypothetical protein